MKTHTIIVWDKIIGKAILNYWLPICICFLDQWFRIQFIESYVLNFHTTFVIFQDTHLIWARLAKLTIVRAINLIKQRLSSYPPREKVETEDAEYDEHFRCYVQNVVPCCCVFDAYAEGACMERAATGSPLIGPKVRTRFSPEQDVSWSGISS